MIYDIPTSRTESNYEQTITLDGETFVMRLLWNDRVKRWFLSLSTATGEPVFSGVKLPADIPIRPHLVGEARHAGQLWVVDTTGQGVDPGLRDLGDRVRLVYVDEASAT